MRRLGLGQSRLWGRGLSGFAAELVRGGIGNLGTKAAETLLTFALTALLAQQLGSTEFGYYSFALLVTSLGSVAAQFGLPPLMLREIASRPDVGSSNSVFRDWKSINGAVFCLSLLLAVGTIFAAYYGEALLPGISLTVFLFMSSLILLLALIRLRSAALRGLRHTVLAQVPLQVVQPLAIIVLIALWALADFAPLHAADAAVMHVAGTVAALVVMLALLRHCLVNTNTESPSIQSARRWLAAAAPFAGIQLVEQINMWADRFVVGALSEPAALGIYTVSAQAALLAGTGIMIVNLVIAPYFARLHSARELYRLERLARVAAGITAAVAAMALIFLTLLGDWFLGLVFGPVYQRAYWAMLGLTVARLVTALSGPCALLLNMSGHERHVMHAFGIAAVANIAVSTTLVPFFGIEGAAAGTLISFLLLNARLFYVVRTRIGINASVFGRSAKAVP